MKDMLPYDLREPTLQGPFADMIPGCGRWNEHLSLTSLEAPDHVMSGWRQGRLVVGREEGASP